MIKSHLRPLQRLAWVCRVALGVVFITAGVLKVGDPGRFAADIEAYRLLPQSLSLPAAYLMPWLEMASGLALIIGRWTKGASIWASAMMVAFVTALVVNLTRGLDIDCGCFGSKSSTMTEALIRDLAILPLCAGALYSAFTRPGPGREKATPGS